MNPPNAIAAQPALNPTPWRTANRAGCVFIDDANGVHIVTFYGNDRFAERQAERICGAVNEREGLLLQLTRLERIARDTIDADGALIIACDNARAAITRAQPNYGRTTIEAGAFGNVE